MSDRYMMESHKLLWHLDRVEAWQKGERIAPLHIDAGLSKGCNIRCNYCFGKIQGNEFAKGLNKFISRDVLLNYMRDAGEAGVRSIALIGEAEPLVNPHVYEAIVIGKKSGADISLGTNGIMYDTGKAGQEALEHLTWIRFNLSASSPEAYRRVHNSPAFEECIRKIRFVVEHKRKMNLAVTVGIQMVLTPDNMGEVVPLARLSKTLGVDYLVIKQCSDTSGNEMGSFDRLEDYRTQVAADIFAEAENESEGDYRVIVKWKQLQNLGRRTYDACLGVPFLIYSGGDGRIYPCGQFFYRREEEFRMGDLNEMSFKQILESDRYWEVVNRVQCAVNVHKECYTNCRTNSINEFLWQLKHAPPHVNFV
jgi:radical SAM protein with 4Fe4S-binding SPASM domain